MSFNAEIGSLLAKAGKARWHIGAFPDDFGYEVDVDHPDGGSWRVRWSGDNVQVMFDDGGEPVPSSLVDLHAALDAELAKPAPTVRQQQLIAAADVRHKVYHEASHWWIHGGGKVDSAVGKCLAAGWLTEVDGSLPGRRSAVPTALGRKVAGLESR